MSTTKTIFWHSWLSLKRNGTQLGFLAIIAISSIYAFYYGDKLTQKQLSVIAMVKEAEKAKKQELNSYLSLDTTIAENAKLFRDKTSPFSVDGLVAKSVISYPSGLSSLAMGQKDIFSYYRKVSGRSLYYSGGTITTNSSSQEIRNPEELLAGNFDFSFVVIYLLPLLIIAFCYNLFSEEKEAGTLSMLTTSGLSIRRLVTTRLLFYFLLVSVFISVLYITGAIVCLNSWTQEGAAFGWFWLGITGYTLFWFAVCYFFISLKQNSAVSALLLLASWLLFLIVVPSAVNSVVSAKSPVHTPADLSRTLQVNNGIIWNKLKDDTVFFQTAVNGLKAKFPQFATIAFDDTLRLNTEREERLPLWHVMFDILAKPEVEEYENSLLRRDEAARRWEWLNPAVAVQNYLCHVAATDKDAYNRFKERIRTAQHRYQQALFKESFLPTANKTELKNMYPVPVGNSDEATTRDFRGLLVIAGFILLLLTLGSFGFKNV